MTLGGEGICQAEQDRREKSRKDLQKRITRATKNMTEDELMTFVIVSENWKGIISFVDLLKY